MTKTRSLFFATLLLLTACSGGENANRPDLGKVWHETEGPFQGTWTRRGDTNTFDAVWTNPAGTEVKDEVTYESISGKEVILYRKGVAGRYYGQLSDDGMKITAGRADWFAPGDSWSATIEK